MILVKVTIQPEEGAALQALVRNCRASLPAGASISEGSFLAALVRADLKAKKEARQKEADRLVRKFADAWMGWVARTFTRTKGAIPIEDIQTWAFEEARKAMVRFDPTMGHSPASLMKTWLDRAKQERRQPAEAAKVDGRQRDARMEEILAGLNVLLERNGEGGADSSKSTGRQRKGRDAQS